MFKRETTSLQEYWETKLGISYKLEFEIYKKLCGKRYKKKLICAYFLDVSSLFSYVEWKQNLLCIISNLDIKELEEYSGFLNQQYRNEEIQFNSFQSLLIPYAICLISGGLLSPVFSMLLSDKDCFSLIMTLLCIVMLIILFKVFCNMHILQLNRSNFYQDMKKVVDEKLKS